MHHLPRLVVMVAKFITYVTCLSNLIISFINNQGDQHKVLKSDQLQPDGCKLFVFLITSCAKKV